jgi:hypothetical protein
MKLWDDESWFVLSTRAVQLARAVGTRKVLPQALNLHAGIHIFASDSPPRRRCATRSMR